MDIRDNFSITNLFITKELKIYVDDENFIIKCPSIKDLTENEELSLTNSFLIKDIKDFNELNKIKFKTKLQFLTTTIFELGKYREFSKMVKKISKGLELILPQLQLDWEKKNFIVNGITITDEICNYVEYILKLSCGDKIDKPPIFESDEARQFFFQQQEYERLINKTRKKAKKNNDNVDKDSLIKSLLLITYAFPSLTFDYLFNQTLAQIHWLTSMANKSVSYSFNEKVFAAGNVKKGSKLDFFIK